MPGKKDIAPPLQNGHCVECGAMVAPDYGSCDEMFMTILTYRITYDERGDHLRRLLVDGFAMQHTKRGGKSAKSYAAHLTGLCCGVVFEGKKSIYAVIQRWLNGRVEDIGITRPNDLQFTGKLTIRYVNDAETEQELSDRIKAWTKEIWNAYECQHEIAKGWIEQALKHGKRR